MSSGKEEKADNTLAEKAAFVLLNCVNGSWNLPVHNCLITALSGEQRTNVIKVCLGMLHDVGVKVCSLMFVGA